ncbi:MAG: lipid biosynthesis acyltransferase [Bacteroidota bacterium]|jgi:predicted LPLAT superfamily acyltransferase|nr:lipid biosynthesis acyltransferase [Bacteroidota bacterium]
MTKSSNWDGQSKARVLGFKIFVFILNSLGLNPAYFFLRIVAFYYFLFSKPNKYIKDYFMKAHGYSSLKARMAVYKNNFLLGQTIIDKVAVMAGAKNPFKVIHKNGKMLEEIASIGKGGILVSAHIGNWEVAGQGLNRLGTPFNILMYANEKEDVKQYMDGVMKEKKINIIAIDEETKSHIIELHRAFSNNELVVMHGDRFRDGAKTLTTNFFGRPAKFPAGPFIMAAKFGVPLCIAFAVKTDKHTYEFSIEEPIQVQRVRGEQQLEKVCMELLQQYVVHVELMAKKYPHQWFNYYDFWKL